MIDYPAVFTALAEADVRYLLVGTAAATAHGSAAVGQRFELLYARDRPNLERLARALAPHQPYPRDAPPGLPFRLDADTLAPGLHFHLSTTLGDLDLLGELAGGGGFESLLPHALEIPLFGHTHLCLDLPALIALARASGDTDQLETIAELEVLLEERGR
jgi:hypothetical protein